MLKKLRFSLLTAVGVCISIGAVNAAEWKFNNGLPEGRGESKQLETFAADVAELSGNGPSVIANFAFSFKLGKDAPRGVPAFAFVLEGQRFDGLVALTCVKPQPQQPELCAGSY